MSYALGRVLAINYGDGVIRFWVRPDDRVAPGRRDLLDPNSVHVQCPRLLWFTFVLSLPVAGFSSHIPV
jgi:hypothetical protein